MNICNPVHNFLKTINRSKFHKNAMNPNISRRRKKHGSRFVDVVSAGNC